MNDSINVPRKLLERIISKMSIVWQRTDETEELRALLQAPAQPAQVQGWQMVPDMTADFSQFLTAVMDAAGLVRHGRQSKELSEYLGSQCMKYRLAAAPQPPVQVQEAVKHDNYVRRGK